MSAALAPWRAPRSVHDPAKILTDIALAVALGGDCAADLAVARAQPQLFGSVASDATVSRLIAALAGDIDATLKRDSTARAQARSRVTGDKATPELHAPIPTTAQLRPTKTPTTNQTKDRG